MGHHLGGSPHKRHLFQTYWASAEGQADYYASLKCMRKLFEFSNNEEVVSEMNIPQRIHDECHLSFNSLEKVALCKRIAMASLSHAQFLNSRNEIHSPVSVNTFDPKVVRKTLTKHPKPQCRLDTSLAGAPVAKEVKLSNEDERDGTCHTDLGFKRGLRPKCWFKSKFN